MAIAARRLMVAAALMTLGLLAITGGTLADDPSRADPPIITGKPSVRVIQQQLRRRGLDSGPVNGRLDNRTRAAVRSFQDSCGLPADVSAGGTLTDRLIHPETCPNAGPR